MKELLKRIKKCKDDKKLKRIIEEKIRHYTKDAKENNIDTDTIGTNVDINPTYHESNRSYGLYIWNGYIPKNTRIVYGECIEDNIGYNQGAYYYLDDETYLFEFAKYIKNKEIDDDYDFILAVNHFLRKYLIKYVNPRIRDEIHQLLYKNDGTYFYRPTKEHSIKDLVKNGAAQCTEFGAIAQNIFSLFDYDIYYLLDLEHAYNMLVEEDKVCILDFANGVECYDINLNPLGIIPYYAEIEDFDEDYFQEVINNTKKFILPDYYCIAINDDLYEMQYEENREYGIDGEEVEEIEEIIKLSKNNKCF